MNKVLYEASFEFNMAFLIPIFMLIFISIFPLIMKKYYENKDVRINYKIVRIFCGCAFTFVALISIIAGVFQVNMFNRTVGAYKDGNYKVVEGYVENFIPMPYEGHSDEEKIKGFYLAESENESHRGSPIRVCFYGQFVEEENNLFFDVYIYPRIIEILFLMVAFIFLSFFGKATGLIISVVVLCLFGKGYYDMMKDTYNRLNRIFS